MIRFLKRPVVKLIQKVAGVAMGAPEVLASTEKVWELQKQVTGLQQCVQILLSLKYQSLYHPPLPAKFSDVEFRAYSQNGEDGILLYIFSAIGTTNKKAVEICAGDGMECNTANLIINHGWIGLLFDGSEQNISRGRDFYSKCWDTYARPPKMVHAWITAENVDSLIRDNGFEGEIDLLSLDMDGVDYWVWKAIDCIRPRVVVLEYNWMWGPERPVTIPYRADHRKAYERGGKYFGASLPAFVKLGREKGYRLVGSTSHELNAFFIRSDIGQEMFPEVAVSTCLENRIRRGRWHPGRVEEVRQSGEWVEV